jgi:hypothetical protein
MGSPARDRQIVQFADYVLDLHTAELRRNGTKLILQDQHEIAIEISGRLREPLSMEQRDRLTKNTTSDSQAYELYLNGRYHWKKERPMTLQSRGIFYNQAIARDPNFSDAYCRFS